MVQPVGDAEQLQHFLKPRGFLGILDMVLTRQKPGKRDIVAGRQIGKQIEFLKHEADGGLAQPRAPGIGQRADILAA